VTDIESERDKESDGGRERGYTLSNRYGDSDGERDREREGWRERDREREGWREREGIHAIKEA